VAFATLLTVNGMQWHPAGVDLGENGGLMPKPKGRHARLMLVRRLVVDTQAELKH